MLLLNVQHINILNGGIGNRYIAQKCKINHHYYQCQKRERERERESCLARSTSRAWYSDV